MQNSSATRQRLQSRVLVDSQKARNEGYAIRVGKQAAKYEIAREAREKWPPIILFNLRASCFDQLAVFDARGTCGFARSAIQAPIDVRDERVAKREMALVDKYHVTNSAARRIGFQAPEFVRRTIIQAQAAVNAARVVVIRRLISAGKATHGRGICNFLCTGVRFSHRIRFHLRSGPGSIHFADQKRFSHVSLARNPAVQVPKHLPRVLSRPGRTPALPEYCFPAEHGLGKPLWTRRQLRPPKLQFLLPQKKQRTEYRMHA